MSFTINVKVPVTVSRAVAESIRPVEDEVQGDNDDVKGPRSRHRASLSTRISASYG
jgi:hypothetical protein